MSSLRELGQALSASDPEERRRAVPRIAELPPADRMAPLLSALGDSDWRVRKEAIGLTAELGPDSDLLLCLSNVFEPGDNVGLRNAAVEALSAFGAFTVELLGSRMSRLDADGKKLAIETLGRSAEPSALDVLAPLVEDADANVRVAALEAIGAVSATRPEDARPLLVARLDRARPLETLAALDALAAIGATLPFTTIEPWLGDPLLGAPALALAAHSGDSRAAAPLLKALLLTRDEAVTAALADYVGVAESARRAATAELARIGDDAKQVLLGYITAGASDMQSVRAALTVVGALGIHEGAELAVSWLSEPHCYAEADQALFMLGQAAVPALLSGASSPDPETAAACLDLVGRLPADAVDRPSRQALARALTAPSPEVVRAALGALTRVGDAACLFELVQLLKDASLVGLVEPAIGAIAVRYPEPALALVPTRTAHGATAHAAAVVIAAIASRSRIITLDRSDVNSFLTQLLMSTSHDERRAALAALAELGGAEALDAVEFALADEEQAVRIEAVRALGKLGGQVGVPALLEVVTEARDPELRLAALRALGESSDARGIGVLGPLVRDSDARIAVTAVEALARHADPRRISSLFDGLHHPDSEVVKAAMLAIAGESDSRVIVHLGACLDQPAWDVRRLAANLLGRAPSEASAALLRARLSVEQDSMVKEALSRALESSGHRRSRPPRRPQGEL